MTPAIKALDKKGIEYNLHQYEHDPDCQTYGDEAARKLGLDPGRVFKTLIAEQDGAILTVSVIPVSKKLDLKALAKKAGAKKAKMADKRDVERATGYLVGGVSPIGQKKRLATVIDESAQQFNTIFISGGKRGLDIELCPRELALLTGASFDLISR